MYMSWRQELNLQESRLREAYRLALISRGKLRPETALYHAMIQPLDEIETYLKWRLS